MRIKESSKKTLYLILGLLLLSICSLTIVYAALSAVLRISGSSEVVASNWNIYLANPEVKSGSVSSTVPTITGNNLSFSANLNTPGDYYEFTVDVVNEGTIDAMIDSVVKTPELTAAQAKYIKYEISYENGESITTNQTIKSGTSTPIKVRIEYRTDISSSDLPSSTNVLDLKLSLIYVQSDGSGSGIPNNGVSVINIVSGDGTEVGNEVCIKDECFYVISSTSETVNMLSKMNITLEEKPKQSLDAVTLSFSSTDYWSSTVNSYPAYVYNSSSNLYIHVENYKTYLSTLGVIPSDARPITYEELESLGCSEDDRSCIDAPDWVYSTSYWSGSTYAAGYIWRVYNSAHFGGYSYSLAKNFGVRPVITISRSYL